MSSLVKNQKRFGIELSVIGFLKKCISGGCYMLKNFLILCASVFLLSGTQVFSADDSSCWSRMFGCCSRKKGPGVGIHKKIPDAREKIESLKNKEFFSDDDLEDLDEVVGIAQECAGSDLILDDLGGESGPYLESYQHWYRQIFSNPDKTLNYEQFIVLKEHFLRSIENLFTCYLGDGKYQEEVGYDGDDERKERAFV